MVNTHGILLLIICHWETDFKVWILLCMTRSYYVQILYSSNKCTVVNVKHNSSTAIHFKWSTWSRLSLVIVSVTAIERKNTEGSLKDFDSTDEGCTSFLGVASSACPDKSASSTVHASTLNQTSSAKYLKVRGLMMTKYKLMDITRVQCTDQQTCASYSGIK